MDRSAIEPDILRFIEAMQAEWAKHPPFASLTLPEARAVAEEVRRPWRSGGPVMAETIEYELTTPGGPLRLRCHVPGAGTPLPAFIYLHGGGFTLFSIDTHDRLMREYAAASGCAVIGVDYPLSPEHRFPVALNRIVALLRALAAGNSGLEPWVDPARLALGGDSAGANLSVAAALALRDLRQGGLVRALLLNYGAFAPGVSDEAEARFGGAGAILDRAEMDWFWSNYLSGPGDAANPLAAPLHADLAALPPSLLVVPELDVLTEQSEQMAARLTACGVDASMRLYPGATHSFLEAMAISALARRAIADGAAFIAAALAR
ncbi:alpha/beta hydrolase [Novosphingobium flavum]|uniref:Alpha/beta hydrolase n=1 Tax=Novosphingobium flavum TaxID=1778672 RepID=A0A7X1KLE5_9SPHN|nr:alpha/beta hydrolase [Novosphingobium flavum]MBC2665531.1 alpha/beta hydrolase [Novosphingobium flavum]